MQMPAFFADTPVIEMIDPLAGFLGAAVDGKITYTYADAVKLAGHSCPTVAGAFLVTRQALRHLYADETPVRGGIRVDLREAQDEGVTGVIGNVIGLISGAAGPGGFQGIGGRFVRRNLLNYGIEQDRSVRFTRLDTGRSIGADYDPSPVPPDPRQNQLLQAFISGQAGPEEGRQFGEIWQQRVARILTDSALREKIVTLG